MFKTKNKSVADVSDIQPIKQHPEVVAACEKLVGLRSQLEAVVKKQLAAEAGVSNDAQAVLDGLPLEATADLQRKRPAIEAAIEEQRRIVAAVERRVQNEACLQAEPFVNERIEVIVAAFESVGVALSQLETLLGELNRRGLRPGLRGSWGLMPLERAVKLQIESYIRTRRAHLAKIRPRRKTA